MRAGCTGDTSCADLGAGCPWDVCVGVFVTVGVTGDGAVVSGRVVRVGIEMLAGIVVDVGPATWAGAGGWGASACFFEIKLPHTNASSSPSRKTPTKMAE
jgi:hypothetical protein